MCKQSIPLFARLFGGLLFMLLAMSCNGQKREGATTEVVLETTMGDIHIVLFDDTPGHRDNFIANVKEGKYDGTPFHRVIRNFMIQTGDPDRRPGCTPDTTKPAERIAAEIIHPKHFHKRGFVGAARDEDEKNPQRMSDRFQFYIVTGKICGEEDIRGYEKGRQARDTEVLYNKMCEEHKAELDAIRAKRDPHKLSDALNDLYDKASDIIAENPPITYSNAQRQAYRSVGGAPWLDGEYTVFGEVVEGMAVVEKIQKVKTNAEDVPMIDIRINKAYIK